MSSSDQISDEQLKAAIRTILNGADLEQTSRRMIRKQLETQLDIDMASYKDKINEFIVEIIREQQEAEEENEEEDVEEPEPSDKDEEDEDEEDESPKAKNKQNRAALTKRKASSKRKRDGEASSEGGAFNMKLSLSPELADIMGSPTMARPQIVKSLWEYIREHNLQDPNNKRLIVLDERLRNVFQRDTVTMFSMNKYLKRHVRKPEDLPPGGWSDIHRDGLSSDDDEEAKAKKKKAHDAKKRKKGGDTDIKEKKNTGFNAELALSPELAKVVGTDRLARPQIVKQMWEYIKAHDLQDPNDKRTILLDDTLQRVFQRDTVTMFSMNKYLKRHAMKPELLPEGGWDDVQRDGASSDEDKSKPSKKKSK